MRISNKLKAVVAAVGTVVTALTAAFADDVVDIGEVGELSAVVIAAGLTVWGVYRVPNKEEAQANG